MARLVTEFRGGAIAILSFQHRPDGFLDDKFTEFHFGSCTVAIHRRADSRRTAVGWRLHRGFSFSGGCSDSEFVLVFGNLTLQLVHTSIHARIRIAVVVMGDERILVVEMNNHFDGG